MEYKGIEHIDSELRYRQRILSEALWTHLTEQGVTTKSTGQIKGVFRSENVEGAKAIASAFPTWDCQHKELDDERKYVIHILCPQCHFNLQAFTELTDIFLIASSETNTIFDGLEVELHNVKNLRSKWWKFWE